MKTLFALALYLVSNFVLADIVAVSSNQSGGMMVLTDDRCPNTDKSYAAWTEDGNGGPQHFGCWVYWEGMVYIHWDGVGVIAYPSDRFTAAKGV